MSAKTTALSVMVPSGSASPAKPVEPSKTPAFDALPPKQQELVRQYLVDFNQSAAARRAGYSGKTANQQASQIFAKLNIRQAVAELVEQKTALTKMTLLEELSAIAFLDPGDYFEIDDRGQMTMKPTIDMTRAQRLGMAGSEQSDNQFGTSRKVKLADKLGALKELATIMNLYPAKAEGSGVNVQINNSNTVKTGILVVPGVASEGEWEAEGNLQRQREEAGNATLRSVPAA